MNEGHDTARPRRRRRAAAVGAAIASLVALAFLGAVGRFRAIPGDPEPMPPVAAVPSVPVAGVTDPPPLRLSVLTVRVGRNQTLGQVLARLALGPGQAQAILAALRDKFPFHRARPGDQVRVERIEGEKAVRRFTYRQSAADEWQVVPGEGGALRGEKRPVAVTTDVARVDVEIRGSVWETLARADEDPALAVVAADVLAWDVDFYQDVRAGDHLKVLVEKVYADGKLLRYGEVLGAEYVGGVTGRKRLFRYTDPAGRTGYYDDDGRSAHRGFLRSPLKYAALSSRFGSRLHPVLGFVTAHQGIDYRAPPGTPVWAVADGLVTQAGWNGACGKAVTLRHGNGIDTVYCHLSTVAVRAGEHVKQKQLLGGVGQTGRATGPHLHYAVKRADRFVNPLGLKVPPDAPVAPAHRQDFERSIAPLRAKLDAEPIA